MSPARAAPKGMADGRPPVDLDHRTGGILQPRHDVGDDGFRTFAAGVVRRDHQDVRALLRRATHQRALPAVAVSPAAHHGDQAGPRRHPEPCAARSPRNRECARSPPAPRRARPRPPAPADPARPGTGAGSRPCRRGRGRAPPRSPGPSARSRRCSDRAARCETGVPALPLAPPGALGPA